MLTSKQRAELRAQANILETTLMVGKGGLSAQLIGETEKLLDAKELIKGRVLETAMLSARECCDALCEATGADGIQVVGSKVCPLPQICQAGARAPGQEKAGQRQKDQSGARWRSGQTEAGKRAEGQEKRILP